MMLHSPMIPKSHMFHSFLSNFWVTATVGMLCLSATLHAVSVVEELHDVPYLEAARKETLDLYLPESSISAKLRPGVVWIHGGGWLNGNKRERREVTIGRALADAGFVVASPDYALAAPGKPTWPLALLDCKNAVRFLRANAAKYRIDPDRIAVMGGSAGGHLALMVAFTEDASDLEPTMPYPDSSSRVSAVVDFYGITNLLTRRKVEKDGVPTEHFQSGSSEMFLGKKRSEDSALWHYASPVSHIKSGVPPVFITHGKRDATVDYLQALELADTLKKAGVDYELVMLENAGHTYNFTHWGKQTLEKDLTPLVIGFLERYLKEK